jgi:dihydrofolate reductase
MNAMPKLVVSHSLEHAAEWQNSTVLQGDLAAEVRKREQAYDIMVTGSVSVIRILMTHDLVDEYRLLVFPLVLGAGTRLFPDGTAPVNLALVSAQTVGPAVRLIYTRPNPASGQPG